MRNIKRSRHKNNSRMSVSYIKPGKDERPLSIEIKMDKKLHDLRNQQTNSQKKLHQYIDQMFEMEEQKKHELQVYLNKKKLECLEYLEQTKKYKNDKKPSHNAYKDSHRKSKYIDEEKLKRTDEFFKNLKLKDIKPVNTKNQPQKLEPIRSSGNSKQRVKWKDSDSNEPLESSNNLNQSYNINPLNLEKPEVNHRHNISQDLPLRNMKYEGRRFNPRSAEDYRYSHRYGSKKHKIEKPMIKESDYWQIKKSKDQVLKITLKNKGKPEQAHNSKSHESKSRQTIELAMKRKRTNDQHKGIKHY